jgi:hypothetical protein
MSGMVFVESTLAINAIKGTQLAVVGQQVDTQRNSQTAAVYWAENRRGVNNC